ncbi:MAG: antirestriction protein ArdA [Actinobacteria bacterium]|nr:antirestriction protein ArdA [Actinomycetota bacterium]
MAHTPIIPANPANTFQTAVWIGCLACYNEGDLVGNWYAAMDAAAISTDSLHQDAGHPQRVDHEELWVMDHEDLPTTGECSPHIASAWAHLLAELDEWERPAFVAWVRSAGTYWIDGDGLPSTQDFRDAYSGQWFSFTDYAADLLDQTGELESVPAHLRGYFDLDSYARDLALDFDVIPDHQTGVWVFHCQ